MATQEHKVDRSGWGPGPWDCEPDRLEWRDEATGLPCLIVRNPMGALCGYVAVGPGHPMHGADDSSDAGIALEVHGGITFASRCSAHGGPICHVPKPGEPDDVWWLGFDCAHGGDLTPRLASPRYAMSSSHRAIFGDESYRDVAYVRDQCANLAAQLAEMA